MSDEWFVNMPKLGESVTEGTVSGWRAAVGDTVALDDVLFEVSTDKVDSEIPSPGDGVILEILVAEDATVPVGTPLVRIGAPGATAAAGNGAAPTPPTAESADAPSTPPAEPDTGAAPESVHDITMPKLGETVTEGTISSWAKEVGDEIAFDDILVEVSTDKVDSEIPSPHTGVIREILVPAGQTVPVGTAIARIGASGAAAAATDPPVRSGAVPAADAQPVSLGAGTDGAGRVLSPLVRRLLAEHRIDPMTVTGSGTGGRIRREDVHAAIAGSGAATGITAPPRDPSPTAPAPTPAAPTPAPAAGPPATAVQPAPTGDRRDEVLALSRLRATIGERMSHSVRTAPHVWTSVEVDLSAVEAARAQHKDRLRREEGTALSPLPFLAHAVCTALRAFPAVNSSLDVAAGTQILHHYVNLGIAVDLAEQGLLAPVIHDADVLTVRGLAKAIATTAAKATSGRATPDDLTGSTFTVTSPGPIADYASAPIINQPNSAILSLNMVTRRPVAVGDAIAIRPMTILGFSYDHRSFDGVTASRFMAHVRDTLQDRDWAAELA